MGRRMGRLAVLVLTVAITALIALGTLGRKTATEVELVSAQWAPLESTIRVTGRVINDRTVTLTALVDGQIKGMLVQKGDVVKAGQTLAFFDKREADALLGKSRALVAREREKVDELQRKLDRLRDVSRAGGASTQVVEDAEAELRASKTQLDVAEAELRLAVIHREKIEVTAPFGGVITEKSTEVGQWVEAGIKLFTLVAEAGREIEAHVDAGDSAAVATGQRVTVTCDAFPGLEWEERVQWIAPAITEDDNDALNTFAVRMTLGPEAPSLLLGQQVDLKIRTAHRERALTLPYNALIESDGQTQVAILREGKVHLREVLTGIEDLSHVEIVEGLEPEDRVILPQGRRLGEGEAVTVDGD